MSDNTDTELGVAAQMPVPSVVPMPAHERDILLLDMARRLGRIEANTDTLVETTDDHEDRLRKVERRQWSVPGLSAMVAILAALGLHPHNL